LQELQPLAPDLDAGVERDAGEVAAGPLVTNPACSGSSMKATIGIVPVAALNTFTTGFVPVTITSGLRATISRATSA